MLQISKLRNRELYVFFVFKLLRIKKNANRENEVYSLVFFIPSGGNNFFLPRKQKNM